MHKHDVLATFVRQHLKMAADFKTAQPVEYYRRFLEEGIRPDGRELLQFRNTVINIGSIATAEGSSIVKLGNTTVACGIKAELANPNPEHPKKGFLVPNLDLPPLCSPRFRPGPPSEQAQVLSQFIADSITNSKMIDVEDLCILEGKLVWCLYIDLICLNYDGNIIDASMTALLGAIRSTKLYKITINEETNNPEAAAGNEIALNIKEHPVASTFIVFDDSTVIADPIDDEESLAAGVITIVVTSEGKLCSVYKPGGCALASDVIVEQCTSEAKKRARCVKNLVDTALQEEA